MSPANTPPPNLLGAPASGMPPGSMIESRPMPCAPFGALANQRRPKALLIEMPSGLLTDGCDAEAALGEVTELRNAGLCAVNSWIRPLSALAWPPALAKPAGTTTVAPSGSIDRIEPSATSGCARGAPKFELEATRMRLASRIRPGWVNAANSGLSRIGPPGWNVPTGATAPAPAMPTATTRAVSAGGCDGCWANNDCQPATMETNNPTTTQKNDPATMQRNEAERRRKAYIASPPHA